MCHAHYRRRLGVSRLDSKQLCSGQQNKVPAIMGSNADAMTTLSNPAEAAYTFDNVHESWHRPYAKVARKLADAVASN